jgi:hypothetical protein
MVTEGPGRSSEGGITFRPMGWRQAPECDEAWDGASRRRSPVERDGYSAGLPGVFGGFTFAQWLTT